MSFSKNLSRVKRYFQVQVLGKENSKGDKKVLDSVLTLKLDYLKKEGWMDSVRYGLPVDEAGNPLPWFTYSSIHFIEGNIKASHNVFEFGSGNSTQWFANRVKDVVSLEHDLKWYEKMKDPFSKYANISYHHKPLDTGTYETHINHFKDTFDIIIIDGRKRIECAKNSLSALKQDGIIIWDNSDRDVYDEGYQFLVNNGFKRLDFWGLGPINSYSWCTSVFYRPLNCFNI
ncbi:MAG: FkbM family methyltransferase [Bacteroidota bacterium]